METKEGFKMPETPTEMYEYAKQLKDEGNMYFKMKDYKKAISKYSRIQLFTKSLIGQTAGGEEA